MKSLLIIPKTSCKLAIVSILCLLLPITGCVEKTNAVQYEYGKMRICVVDGFTGEPIEGAAVVVPEAELCNYTNGAGMTELMELPVILDTQYDELLRFESGRITLIVYADGYIPYALLYARVFPGVTRSAPTILMFPDDGSIPVFSVIESPSLEWAAGLVEKYRP